MRPGGKFSQAVLWSKNDKSGSNPCNLVWVQDKQHYTGFINQEWTWKAETYWVMNELKK